MPTLSQSVALITQAAYLQSLTSYLDSHPDLADKLKANEKSASELVAKKITKLADLELNDKEARFALVYFPESKLADKFNEILISRLEDAGITEEEITKTITYETSRYIETILSQSEATKSIKEIRNWYNLGGKKVFEKYIYKLILQV